MEIIEIFIKVVAEAFADRVIAISSITIALLIGGITIFLMVRHQRQNQNDKIEERLTEVLNFLEDIIFELKNHVYHFDADSYQSRSGNVDPLLIAQSHHLNARLNELYDIKKIMTSKSYKSISELEKDYKVLKNYQTTTKSMIKGSIKTNRKNI